VGREGGIVGRAPRPDLRTIPPTPPLGLGLTHSRTPTPTNTVHRQSRARGGPVMMAGDSGVLKVTGEELEKALTETGSPVLLDVYAQWCGPCQILAGELDKVKGLYKDKLRVLKVDSDEEPAIASALKVYGTPLPSSLPPFLPLSLPHSLPSSLF